MTCPNVNFYYRWQKNYMKGVNMYPNLKAEMVRKGLSLKDLAKQTNIRYETFCKKCRGGAEFTIPEIYKIIEIFGMTFEYLFKRDEELGDSNG